MFMRSTDLSQSKTADNLHLTTLFKAMANDQFG